MNRRSFFKWSGIGLVSAAIGGLGIRQATAGNRYYSGLVSDHFDGKTFFNPGGEEPRGLVDVLRWKLGGDKAEWPSSIDPSSLRGTKPDARVPGSRIVVTMVGHATLLIQTGGLNILTDPVWSQRVSPVSFAGPRRVQPPGVAFDDLPPIDVVIVTHNHYDHLDVTTLDRLVRRDQPQIITPLGNDRIILSANPSARVAVMDWGDRLQLDKGLIIHCEPCHHWSARGLGDRRMALWAAFVLETPGGKIFHIGDTGFDEGRPYRQLREKHGALRLAILPIGAYAPRWFMKAQHQDPDEAVEGWKLSGADYAIGHHFGTFQLTDEPIDEPPQRLQQAMTRHGLRPDRFRPLTPGETFDTGAVNAG